MSRPRKDPFTMRRYEAERKALLREGPPPVQLDRWVWHFTDMRVHCANCGALNGSKKTNVYYPDSPCRNCGSTKMKLRNFDGYKIDWEKWLIQFGEREDRSYYGYPDYEY